MLWEIDERFEFMEHEDWTHVTVPSAMANVTTWCCESGFSFYKKQLESREAAQVGSLEGQFILRESSFKPNIANHVKSGQFRKGRPQKIRPKKTTFEIVVNHSDTDDATEVGIDDDDSNDEEIIVIAKDATEHDYDDDEETVVVDDVDDAEEGVSRDDYDDKDEEVSLVVN